MSHTLTALRVPVPATKDGPQGVYLWTIDFWGDDHQPVTVESGRAHTERMAYQEGLQAALKLGLCAIGGSARTGYDLGERHTHFSAGAHRESVIERARRLV